MKPFNKMIANYVNEYYIAFLKAILTYVQYQEVLSFLNFIVVGCVIDYDAYLYIKGGRSQWENSCFETTTLF